MLGIQNEGLAYNQILIALEYDIPLEHVSGTYNSMRGKISVAWKKTGNKIVIKGEIPANTNAKLRMPNGEVKNLGNGIFNEIF